MVPRPTKQRQSQPPRHDIERRWSVSAGALVELLPGRLAWAPESLRKELEEPHVVPALELCRHGAPPESKAGRYHVPHYAQAICGDAFGPLNLESTLRFCRGLEARLQQREAWNEGPLVLATPPGDKNYLANAAVLLGAYLILRHGLSVPGVVELLGAEQADATFVCSWPSREPQRFLRVRHCLLGFELARARGWIAPEALTDEAAMEEACSTYTHMLHCYDAAWLVPGMLMVSADPPSVVHDPNPCTCARMFPLAVDDQASSAPAASNRTTSTCTGTTDSDVSSSNHGSTPDLSAHVAEPATKGTDFVSFMLESRICLAIRTNYEEESGSPLKRYGYDDNALRPYGIRQANFPVVDKRGGLPMPADVAQFLRACEDVELGPEGSAVLTHCKAGFGRSVVCSCLLAVHKLDLPGAAMLGWARIVRPGAFTTKSQEAMVASMRGRRDVESFARMNRAAEEASGKSGTSCIACRTQ